MYLSKIELFGFKSFAHRVTIKFDKGLTAIVGPNGCGKTNVVDAIRWVLGEQKSSLLRSEKMENIIFNGSKNLKPLSLTEVSLTIENTRNVLPTEYTEVTVTRRLYRNGDSDYLLNQVPCRLKDILDLFTDTGMGSDAYSVIELKMIEEIISNKSEERLKLFEEAAGITRYKQRRKQTFRQLESASRDLSRVDDVIAEVEKKVRNLKLQVKKAEKLREIKNKLRELDLILSQNQFAACQTKLEPLRRQLSREEMLDHERAAAIAQKDSAVQDAEVMQLNKEQELASSQKKLNDLNNRIHELEKQLLQDEEQRKSLSSGIGRIKTTAGDKQKKSLAFELTAKALGHEKPALQKECDKQLAEYKKLSAEHEELNSRLQEHRQELAEKRKKNTELEKTLNRLSFTRHSLETKIEHRKTTSDRLGQQKLEIARLLDQSSSDEREISEKINARSELVNESRKSDENIKNQIKILRQSIETQKEKLLGFRSERDQLRNQIMLANAVLDNFEGLPEGIAFLEKQNKPKSGIGCLSDLVSLDRKHRKAVNAALGELLGYYICRTLDDAKQSIAALSRSDKGKVHFLVLELVQESVPKNRAVPENEALRVIDLLQFPPELDNVLALMLHETYLVRDLNAAETLAMQHPQASFVTPEGEKFSGKGVLFGGSSTINEGLRLGKKAERDRLLQEQQALEKTVQEAERMLTELNREIEGQQKKQQRSETEKHRSELELLEKSLTRIDAERNSRRQTSERMEAEIREILDGQQQLEQEAAELIPEIHEHESLFNTALEMVQKAQENLAALETRHHQLSLELQKTQNIYRDSLLEVEKLDFRIGAAEQNRKLLLDEIKALASESAHLTDKAEKLECHHAKIKRECEELLIRSAGEQEQLKTLELDYREMQSANHDAHSKLRDLRRQHEISQQILASLHAEERETTQSLDHLITAIKVKYNTDLTLFETPPLEEPFDQNQATEKLALLENQREQFGAVNELALEEYEVEKERLDFLLEQKADLESAALQLRNTIDEINKTALLKFRQTCTSVRKNFITIFHELFDPEDEVDLIVHTIDDPLEARIEIVAKPKGKKPLSIEQLSGGEKALTALSLLFAIYLVKPSPFCILDEVDAPLDDANVGRFIKLLKKFENNTQFIIVTHNKNSMASCHALYGVTMEEEGVSKLIPVRLQKTGL
ncbi:MAG: chromosome segregation protein SMC [Chlorobium sp.]|jgi:chromosome segregation protein|nr:chromosome segregation protein SMC [Chlorobium sp.]